MSSFLHVVDLASQGQHLLRRDVVLEQGQTTSRILTLFREGFSESLPRNRELKPSISVLALNSEKYEMKKLRLTTPF
jgi:hypothetical protein